MTYKTIPIKTEYIIPGEGYSKIIKGIIEVCENNDYIIISETPISTAENNLVDESQYIPGILAYILTELWGRYIWGYILGPLLKYKKRTINNLRKMPPEARVHKQFILEKYGLKHALQPTAEAGVDLSNVPGQYVSLLPENPMKSAHKIQKNIKEICGKDVHIIIIDTDATYEIHEKLFTTIPLSLNSIKNNTGIIGYFLKIFSKKVGPTILASTIKCNIYKLIELGTIAEKCQKENNENFFETIYNMQNVFDTDYNQITNDMLKTVTHIPAVLIRFE
ncbi:coenzyme F420-0:L-glutamate ligase [Methanosphaera sp. WGK6]|uniref:coenzyme F420-0:L-glutamate ligase n=1 Tax=Methanosphaera sp. WGK6 TaxID=1561964 RepID=UPI000AAD2908|nr:coenzyme F420-0:L-glutamate ligase [Methanosphaera sp. WGK6]